MPSFLKGGQDLAAGLTPVKLRSGKLRLAMLSPLLQQQRSDLFSRDLKTGATLTSIPEFLGRE